MVDVVHWNPRRNRLPVLRRYRLGRRVGNFGDLIGPLVVDAILERDGLAAGTRRAGRDDDRRLLAVGSIVHLAREGDVVWGSGVNGKIPAADHAFESLDVRAVRGPLTREWLSRHKGIDAPEVYGDPALALPLVRPDLFERPVGARRALTIVPNLNDVARLASHPAVVDPRRPVDAMVDIIRASDAVVASSLHAIVIAELAGIPVVPLSSGSTGPLGPEPPFKYQDYYNGTGRELPEFYDDVDLAIAAVRHTAPAELDAEPVARGLLAAFPRDLWEVA